MFKGSWIKGYFFFDPIYIVVLSLTFTNFDFCTLKVKGVVNALFVRIHDTMEVKIAGNKLHMGK